MKNLFWHIFEMLPKYIQVIIFFLMVGVLALEIWVVEQIFTMVI